MKKLIVLVVLGLIGWQAFTHYEGRRQGNRVSAAAMLEKVWSAGAGDRASSAGAASAGNASFRCNGRKYCSQMASCAEATYFLKNCPGVKMDGNGDGVPCEKQWCR